MHRTDKEIVQEVLAGKKQRYAEIVTRYEKPVFNLMYRYTRHELDAADLTQEVFVRAFDKLSRYRHEYSLFSWLYALAINVANDWSRSRTRIHRRAAAFEANHIPVALDMGPAVEAEERDQLRILTNALDQLPPETREILILRYRYEQPVRELAAAFEMTESAIKMRVKRGLEQLQKILRADVGHEE
jgi:RNA polymerase sigma-70 factor (ECF subfamily)